MFNRRSPVSRGFVKWPEITNGKPLGTNSNENCVYDSGEGGMECWLVIVNDGEKSVRNVCITGFEPSIVTWDSLPGNDEFTAVALQNDQHYDEQFARDKYAFPGTSVRAAICIGASGQSPFYGGERGVWQATRDDLTADGQALYDSVRVLYDAEPILVMVLDT